MLYVLRPAVKTVLQGCATSQVHYYGARDERALEQAFNDMTASFLDLRIAR